MGRLFNFKWKFPLALDEETQARSKRDWLKAGVRISFAAGIAFFLCQIQLDWLESLTYDYRVRFQPTPAVSGRVSTIAIDAPSVEALQRDPNANDHLQLLKALAATKPKAIVYTFYPSEIVGSYDELQEFADLSANLPVFVAGQILPIKGLENELKLAPPLEKLEVIPGMRTSDSAVLAKDNVSRRFIFSFQGKRTLHPHLAELITGPKPESEYKGLYDFYGSTQALIDFRPRGTYPAMSFFKAMNGEFDPKIFADKIVFIGRDNMTHRDDYILTPYSREVVAMSNLEMHANIMDTVLLNSAPIKGGKWLDLALTIAISILTVYVVLSVRPARGLMVLALAFGGFILLSYLIFVVFDFIVPMAHPIVAIFICYYFFIPYRLIMENRTSWEYFQKNRLLTQVEELKSNFLRMMSHDLKTPLARIQGMTELVLRDGQNLSESQRSALVNIRKSSEELSDFIGSILNLGRIESKEIKLQLKSKDINVLLTEVVKKLEFLASAKNIKIICDLEPMFSVKMDEDLMRQVFTNLVENAIKYSPEGSRIMISTEEVEGRVVVQVADQGIGIDKKDLPNVFTKFYRSSAVVNSEIKGSGLGLYLSQYFVQLHRGEIAVESELAKGSTFTVALPMNLEV